MRKTAIIIILFLISLQLISQTKDEIKLIQRIEKSEIVDLSFVIDSSYKSNEPINFKLDLTDKKGKKISSEGVINYQCFEIEGTIANINKKGQLVLNHSEVGLKKEVIIIIKKKGKKPYSKNIIIALNYKGLLNIDYSGKAGKNGENGTKGRKFITDSIVSSGIGNNGICGYAGEDGHSIDVYVIKGIEIQLNRHLLSITVKDKTDSTKKIFFTDPDNSEILINVSGGKGGNGGHGGKGAKGDKNISGWIDTKPGYYGGNGGNGGIGGNCGIIQLYIDSNAIPYKGKFQIISKGGIGGKPGLPGERGEFGDSEDMGKTYSYKEGYLLPRDLKYENEGSIGPEGECNNTPKVITAKLNIED